MAGQWLAWSLALEGREERGRRGAQTRSDGVGAEVPEGGDLGLGLPHYIFVYFSVCAQLPQTMPHAG